MSATIHKRGDDNCQCTSCRIRRQEAGPWDRRPGAINVVQDAAADRVVQGWSPEPTGTVGHRTKEDTTSRGIPDPRRPLVPVSAVERKGIPIASGFIDYFPLAVAAVAKLSRIGNDQHNPGKPLHWDRSKSGDEGDALMRHFLERGTTDTDGVPHSVKVAWRAMALLQKEIETCPASASFLEPPSS